jgi:RNA polymerase sigma-70 factor (ECF subfamily)
MSTEATLQLPPNLADATSMIAEGDSAVCPVPLRVDQDNVSLSSDENLLEDVTNSSKDALGTLFQRHGRAVFHVAWRILRDDAEAADVRQEVFLYIFQKAKLFDRTKGSASSWIMQIAYRRAIDRRRYLANRQHYTAPVFDEHRSEVGAAPPSTDTIDGRAILGRLRETLSEEQRQTVELHLFEGYSLREIAEKNGQSIGNVRHHYYRALDRLRAQLFARKCE